MVKELNKEDIIKKLNTDFAFLVRFILDNNLNAVVQNLKVAGVKVPLTYTKKDILDIVYTEIARGNVDEMLKALNVPYLASADNYTDGFEDYFNPTTKTEEMLCAIWSEVLDIANVGVESNFFRLGGDSM